MAPLPRSSWTDAAPPAPPTPRLTGETRADACVVGCGFAGLSAALHLAEAGADVVAVEAEEPGFGASGRNGGQVIPGLKHDPDAIVGAFGPDKGEAIAAFAGAAPDLVFDLIARHGIDCGAVRAGWMQAAHAPAGLAKVEARVRQWSARGAPIELLDRAETERRTGARGYVGALLDRRGGTLNPLAYARGLARAAIAAGARLHGGTPAVGLSRGGGGWRVDTPAGAVRAGQVLLATNAYTDALWPGLARTVIPVWSYAVVTRPMGANLREAIMPGGLGLADTRRLLNHCRQDGQGRLLVGGRGFMRESTDPADFREVHAALRRLFPAAAELELDHVWGGKVALTLDEWPNIGPLAPGLTAAIGFNGRGVAMATAVGREMARHLGGMALEDLPLPVRPIRPLPFHALRAPALAAAIRVKKLQDWWEVRGAGSRA